MGHDSTKINHRQNKFGAKRKRKAKKVKISALTDDLESSINDMSFGSEETNESPSALTSLLNDSELLASHDDTDSPVCGGFWLPLYHDLYHGDVRAITNHLEINQTFHMKSKGVKVVRTDDFKNPFLFQCVECTGHVGDKQKFIVENNTKKTICLKCFNFRNHSTFRRHISFLKETKYNIENSLIFKRSLELPSYDSIIDNLSRDDALSLLRLIMQGQKNKIDLSNISRDLTETSSCDDDSTIPMNSSDQHNISVDTAEMTYINDDDSFIDEEEDYKFLNISDSTVMVDRRNFFFDEDIDDSASWIIDKIFDKSHPIIVDSLMFDVETSGDENLSIEEENCITNLKLSADELKLSARSSFNKTVDLTKEVETQDDFMHLRKRLSQPDETEISKITTEQPSFSSNYNLRSNHSKELLENMRDVSLDCIRDSITDLVFLLYSYVEHTRTHNSSEVILSTHTSLCLASNYLERLEQELRGVKHVNKPCHPETYSVMFDFYLKTTGSSYKFIAKTLNMPSLDSMRIKARSIGTSSNCRIQYDSIREHCRLIKLLKKKMLDRGASCREVRSIDYTKLTMDGTQLGGILGIGFDHNNNTIQNLVNLKSLSNSYEILTVESEKRQLELMTAKYAVITNETSILIGSTSKIITTVGYLTNENSNTVCSQFDEAYLISIANGGIPVIKLSDNASWNNKVFSDQQTVSQLYTKEENIIKSNLHRGADRKYYCATISPYYSGSQLKRMAPDFWVPLLFLIFDYVHTVFKTPRNHLITKKIALFSAAGKSIIFDWDILRAAVQQFEQNDVSGLRKVARLDINSIWAAGDNSANKMTVKTATATFSSKHQRYLTLLRDSLCEEYGLSEKLLFQVNGEDVYASRVIDIVDGFLPLANVFNRGFDALNGVQKLNRNRSRKLYIDSITGIEEFEKIREISRSIDTLGNLVCNTNGLSLSSNHWLLGAARAVGKSCHGVVSFLIYFTSILVPGSKFSMGILNADDNEQSFSWLRSKCSIFDMKSFMRSLVLLNHHRSRMLEGAIESLFKYTKKNTNKYNTVLYSRNTNSRVSDDENDVSDNDEAQMKINVKRTNNSRTLNGEKSTDCASKLQEHARSNNINNMAAKHMLPQIG